MLHVLWMGCLAVFVLVSALPADAVPGTAAGPAPENRRHALAEYVDKLQASLEYMVEYSAQRDNSILSANRIAPGEAHIVFKIHRALKALLQQSSPSEITGLMANGYQCSAHGREQQDLLRNRISMGLCSEIEWYKVAALAAPHLRTIVDVGSNKGLMSALFISLWGGGDAIGITPRRVYDIAAEHGFVMPSEDGVRASSGFCKYGNNLGTPLLCSKANRDPVALTCHRRGSKGDLHLYSFDGASEIAALTRSVQATLSGGPVDSPAVKVGQGVYWEHHHTAIGSETYVANFTLPSTNAGNDDTQYTQSRGFEGS